MITFFFWWGDTYLFLFLYLLTGIAILTYRSAPFENLQSLKSIGRRFHLKAALFEKAANGVADQHGIVDHQRYGRHLVCACGNARPRPAD